MKREEKSVDGAVGAVRKQSEYVRKVMADGSENSEQRRTKIGMRYSTEK